MSENRIVLNEFDAMMLTKNLSAFYFREACANCICDKARI